MTPAQDGTAEYKPPYPASWVDRMTAWIEGLPGPAWFSYLAGFLVFLALLAWSMAGTGASLSREIVFSNLLPFYGFWLIYHLNRQGVSALAAFQPAFSGEPDELREIEWRLTVLPRGRSAVISIAALLIGVASSLGWGWSSTYQVLSNMAYIATVVFASLYGYHALRQLRLVTWLSRERSNVDLYNPAPLYAFSTLTSHTAIGMLLILSGAALITPAGLVGGWLAGSVAFAGLAASTFLLPLLEMHRRLVKAKDKELLENNRRWHASMLQVYSLVDAGEGEGIERVNATLSALERGRTSLERLPTWPWRPETLRSMVAALILPVVISIVQYGLRRLFG